MDREARALLRRQLARLADGDRRAFDAVYDAALPPVRRLALRILGDPVEADDATQEALLKVFARASEYDPSREPLAWILAITAFECRTLRKRRTRRREELCQQPVGQQRSEAVCSQRDPEHELLTRELRGALADVMGSLSASDVETIVASLDREQRGSMAVAAATFRKRLQRALARFRQAWRERHGES